MDNLHRGVQLSKMLMLAVTRHNGQFDKGGNPYILHPLKVMYYLKTDDEELQCIALGHDLVEDCFKTTEEGMQYLYTQGFSNRILRGIEAMTKNPGEDFEVYKRRVKANPDAVLVKMADLRHNTDIRRLKGIREKDFDRMRRYHEFYMELKELAE